MELMDIDQLLDTIDSKYSLCIALAKRARELGSYLTAKRNVDIFYLLFLEVITFSIGGVIIAVIIHTRIVVANIFCASCPTRIW